ncbi:MAG: hypothetical protein FWF65_09140, partial [Bacteroidetes bacterium]|nr:hypothetical protein [Bacteroidota bacterium]
MKKFYDLFKKTFALMAIIMLCSIKLSAVNYYWVGRGNDNNWTTVGNWSTTSGGVGNVLIPPTATDNVIVDANSFQGTTIEKRTITVDGTATCDSLIFRGPFNTNQLPILTINADMNISGSVLFYQGMTLSIGSAKNIYLQSTRSKETFSIAPLGGNKYVSHNVNIVGSANWTIDYALLLRSSATGIVGRFSFTGTGTLFINGALHASNVIMSGDGYKTINGDVISSNRFYFCDPTEGGGNANLSINGALRATYYSAVSGSNPNPAHGTYIGGTGIKDITGDFEISFRGYLDNGIINIGGDFITNYHTSIYDDYNIRNQCKVTLSGNLYPSSVSNQGFYIKVIGAGTEFNFKGNILTNELWVNTNAKLDNMNLKGVVTLKQFISETNATVNLSGSTVNSLTWKNSATPFTAATAPALIKLTDGYTGGGGSSSSTAAILTAIATDVYNNVEIINAGNSASTINTGKYNKITFIDGNGSISTTTPGITTDTLILLPQKKFTFYNNSNNNITTNIVKRLEILPQTCGGVINVESNSTTVAARIIMGAGSVVDVESARIANITITGAPPYTARNSIDGGGNTGWTFPPAQTTTYYWVGGKGYWDDKMHWANGSNGTPGSGCVPSIFNSVVFDQYSGLNNMDSVIIDGGNAYCDNMTWKNISGTPSLRIVYPSYLYIGGSLELNPGMFLRQPVIYFVTNRPNETIKTNGVQMSASNQTIYFQSGLIESGSGSGAGGWKFLDDFSGSCRIQFTKGNLNFNGKNVTINSFISTGSDTRTLNITGSTILLTDFGAAPANNGTPPWTYNGTGAGVLTDTHTANSRITTGWFRGRVGDKYNEVVISHQSSTVASRPVENGTFKKLTLQTNLTATTDFQLTIQEADTLLLNAMGVTYSLYSNITVNKKLVINPECGSSSNLRQAFTGANTPTNNVDRYITMGAGAVVNVQNLIINRVHISGNPTPPGGYPAPDCELVTGNETGWNISSPFAFVRYYWVGGTGNWDDLAHWSNRSGGTGNVFCVPPRPTNTVVFDQNSFTANNQSVTIPAITATCDSMLWVNIPYSSPGLLFSYSGTVYSELKVSGSVFLQEGMRLLKNAYQGSGTMTMNSVRPKETFKINGAVIGNTTEGYTILVRFDNTGEMDFPDGLLYGYSSNSFGSVIIFGVTTASSTAVWKFKNPLVFIHIPSLNGNARTGYVYFNYGTLDFSESGRGNNIPHFRYDSSRSRDRQLIIKNSTLNINNAYFYYDGILTEQNSKNSHIFWSSNSPGAVHDMQTAQNQVYDTVTFVSSGTLTIANETNPSRFNRVVFGNAATVTRGIYSFLRFKHKATMESIEADTLWFAQNTGSTEYIYTFISGSTNTINKRWYGSGNFCYPLRIQSSTKDQFAYLNVKKEVATIGDTLFMDFLRVTDISPNTGTNLAKLRMGPMCPYNILEGRIFNAPATCPNWTIDPQDPTFRRLGPDVVLSPSDFPFEISSAYFVITPESTFEWKKGTQDGTGGTALNTNPLTDKTTTSWFVNSPADANDYYYLKVRYNIEGLSPDACVLDASKRVDNPCSVGSPSSTPTVCMGLPITPITIATTDITGIGTPVNLPANLTASFANNTITISGTPTVADTFNYSIPLTSVCGPMNATGTITVTPALTQNDPSAATICSGSTNTFTLAAATGASGTITYQWQSSTNGTDWSNISGATNANYTTPALTTNTYYRRQATATPCG